MTIVNCTPHPVTVLSEDGTVLQTFPKGTTIPRLSVSTEAVGQLDGIPVTKTVFGETVDLPARVAGTYYIVSRLVLSANTDRDDLLVPDQLVRNAEGHIMGCRSFSVS